MSSVFTGRECVVKVSRAIDKPEARHKGMGLTMSRQSLAGIDKI